MNTYHVNDLRTSRMAVVAAPTADAARSRAAILLGRDLIDIGPAIETAASDTERACNRVMARIAPAPESTDPVVVALNDAILDCEIRLGLIAEWTDPGDERIATARAIRADGFRAALDMLRTARDRAVTR